MNGEWERNGGVVRGLSRGWVILEFLIDVVAFVRSAGGEWIKVVRDGDRAVARAGVRAPMPRMPRTPGRGAVEACASSRARPRWGPP